MTLIKSSHVGRLTDQSVAAITTKQLTVGRSDITRCRDLSGAIEHLPDETAEMLWASEELNNTNF